MPRRVFQGRRQLVFSESDLEEERFGVACGAGTQCALSPRPAGNTEAFLLEVTFAEH